MSSIWSMTPVSADGHRRVDGTLASVDGEIFEVKLFVVPGGDGEPHSSAVRLTFQTRVPPVGGAGGVDGDVED